MRREKTVDEMCMEIAMYIKDYCDRRDAENERKDREEENKTAKVAELQA